MKWSEGVGAVTRLLLAVGVAILIFATLTAVWWHNLPPDVKQFYYVQYLLPALAAWEIFWTVVRRFFECLLGNGIGC